ncbi:MAG: hypothetical protein U9M94_03525 [Patescibacteria group bacterium]|nr:hypothetical protein [Patescibacteria group bacterium]
MELFFVADKRKSPDVENWIKNKTVASRDLSSAKAICVAGGDGFLLHNIHKYWKQGLPFIGINRGTVGFLLNSINSPDKVPVSFNQLNLIFLRLIQGEFITRKGEKKIYLAFNDIFCGGNIADFITFKISGELNHFPERISRGNGIVVSTAQGTTGFVLNARGTAALLPLDSKNWFVGGVATGPYPCDQVSPQKIIIEVESRRSVNGYADGYSHEVLDIKKIIVTPTKHIVTLGFLADTDFAARRTQLAQKLERGE